MPDYGFEFNIAANTTSAYKTAGLVVSNGTRRVRVYEFSVGQFTPNATDSAVQWDGTKVTAATTANGTAAVVSPLDAADAAATSTAISNYTSEPTYGAASMWNLVINQRAAYRWIAKDGKEIVVAAVTSGGFGLRMQGQTASAYTGGGAGSVFYTE